MMKDKQERERGSALPMVALAAMVMLALVLVVAGATDRVRTRAEAQAAADAAALAGAIEGVEGANDLAGRNGGIVVGFEQVGNEVVVQVEVDGVLAEARAERRLVSPGE